MFRRDDEWKEQQNGQEVRVYNTLFILIVVQLLDRRVSLATKINQTSKKWDFFFCWPHFQDLSMDFH